MSKKHEKDNDVCILLTVWGGKYIENFFQLSLATLLAPGNIPALKNRFKSVKFIFLTRKDDKETFPEQPGMQQLSSFCEVEYAEIDDLIVIGNYSTTLTLAYERAIRQMKRKALNTYFIFLTSDYIMADGSFSGLIRYINKGYSGICTGNFQVIKSDIEPYLKKKLDPNSHSLSIKPRELFSLSLDNLHPIVIASFLEQKITHNYLANRFYIKEKQSVIAGRFYLLHMLCIKPEITNFRVGSSCDYSFIPEMCPSGKVAIINDSDDYFVVEIQSKDHELNYIDWGPYDTKKLSQSLAGWTTERHRLNAKKTIYFHGNDLNRKEKKLIHEKLNTIMAGIEEYLAKYNVQPYYDHPFWRGAIRAFENNRNFIKKYDTINYFDINSVAVKSPARRLLNKVFGREPAVYVWHYRYHEFRKMKGILDKFNQDNKPSDKIIFLYDTYLKEFMEYYAWFKSNDNSPHHYHFPNLISIKRKFDLLSKEKFTKCIYFVRLDDLESAKSQFNTLRSLLVPGGKILLVIVNERNHYSYVLYNFSLEFANKISYLVNSRFTLDNVTTVHNNLTLFGSVIKDRVSKLCGHNKKMKFLLYILIAIPGIFYIFFSNLISFLWKKNKGHCTDILVTLTSERDLLHE